MVETNNRRISTYPPQLASFSNAFSKIPQIWEERNKAYRLLILKGGGYS